MGEDPTKVLDKKSSEGPEAIREQIKVGDVVEKDGKRLTVLALVGKEEALLSPPEGGEEEVANIKDLKKVSAADSKEMPNVGNFPLASKKEKADTSAGVGPKDEEDASKTPETMVMDEFQAIKKLREREAEIKKGEDARKKEREEFEGNKEQFDKTIGRVVALRNAEGDWRIEEWTFSKTFNKASVLLKNTESGEERIIPWDLFNNSIEAIKPPNQELDTQLSEKEAPKTKAMGASFIEPTMARSVEGLQETIRMNASELADAAKRENAKEKINKAKNLKELKEAVKEIGEIEGTQDRVYKAEDINERLEQLCAHIKEVRMKAKNQWWDEEAIRNMAQSMFGITNGAKKDGLRIRDTIIKLLRPENADWLLEDEQATIIVKEKSWEGLKEKTEGAKTLDDLIRALEKADEEAQKYGHEVLIQGSEKSYSAVELINMIKVIKEAMEEGKEQEALVRTGFITNGEIKLGEAVKRIILQKKNVRRMAEELPDMIGEDPFK